MCPLSMEEESNSYQSEDKPVRVTVVEISVHLFGQLQFVHVLLKDPCSSYRVNLKEVKGRRGKRKMAFPRHLHLAAAPHRLFMQI